MAGARFLSPFSTAGLDPAIQSRAHGAYLIAGWPARGPAMEEFLLASAAKVLH
jgi:hypothetical protein